MTSVPILERMTVVRSGALHLEALWQGGDAGEALPPVVFASPHPRLGGNMDAPVLSELVWTLGRVGHATLRFNWRGVGASEGTIDIPPLPADGDFSLTGLVGDLVAAVAHQCAPGPMPSADDGPSPSTAPPEASPLEPESPAILVGYSIGAFVVAQALGDGGPLRGVRKVILVSPPVAAVPTGFAELLRVGDARVVSVVTGADDGWAPPDALRSLGLPVHVIPGAGHAFARGLTALARTVADLLQA